MLHQADGSVAWNSLLTFSPAEPADMMLTMSLRHKQGLATGMTVQVPSSI